MSSGPQEQRETLLSALARELRQLNGLGASFFRVAAGRVGMTVTDLQVIDILDNGGPMTAGQLADLTGLTTGAITGVIGRLEEAGVVQRGRDPEDGRRVIVQLITSKERMNELGALFAALERAWDDAATNYDDAQLALLVEFLQRSNVQTQQELSRIREPSENKGGNFSTPRGDVTVGQLLVAEPAHLTLRADATITELYQARFEGPVPDVQDANGVVNIRYPRRLWGLGSKQRKAEITLSGAIPWQIIIQGGAAEIAAELEHLMLAGLEVKGGVSMIRLSLPEPTQVVPVRVSGSASDIVVRRPPGAPARVHLKGWASVFVFDEQHFTNIGNDVRMQSPTYRASAPSYDIEVTSSASMVTITTE